MVFFSGAAFLVSVSTFLVVLFIFIYRIYHRNSCTRSKNISSGAESRSAHRVETKIKTSEVMGTEKEEVELKDSPKLVFKFPSYEEFLHSNKGHDELVKEPELLDEKGVGISGGGWREVSTPGGNIDGGFSLAGELMGQNLEAEVVREDMLCDSVVRICEERLLEKLENEEYAGSACVERVYKRVVQGTEKKMVSDQEELQKEMVSDQEKLIKEKVTNQEELTKEEELSLEKDVSNIGAEKSDQEEFTKEEELSLEKDVSNIGAEKSDQEEFTKEEDLLLEKDVSTIDSDSESIVSSLEFSIISHFIGSYSDELPSIADFDCESELSSLMYSLGTKEELSLEDDLNLEEMNLQHSSNWHNTAQFEEEEEDDILFELKNLEEAEKQNDSHCENENSEKEDEPSSKPYDAAENTLQQDSHVSLDFDSEESNGLETLWEHQEFLEQLKMDIKKGRAYGLPTIEEEEEEPKPFKIIEDFKPWKIDEKFHHEDRMHELFKFYKSYRDRMRKFDILNFQKLYAIGFLQKKDPVESISICKSSPSPAIASLLLDNFRICRPKKSQVDPMAKAIREWRSDLEVVYVGQLCLSWEFLHWQYEKVLELWDADPYGVRLYNEVAGKFQQFQVLVQRFLETEPFGEGSRVQLYIKNRCVMRSFLQVPVVKEDTLKDIKKAIKEGKGNAITGDILVEIMEESIRVLWQFVRGEKDANHSTLGRRRNRVELQDPTDSQLLLEIKDSLEKKEKKLKDLRRSGNCILRKLRKHQEDDVDQVLCFFSQVDMKLVRRVLNMSRLNTEQLMWCRDKLGRINFVGRKIHVEPSFMLFPC